MPNVLRPRQESPTPLMRLVLPLLLAALVTLPLAGFGNGFAWLAMLCASLPLAASQARQPRGWKTTLFSSISIAFAAALAAAVVAFLTHDWE